MALKSIFFAGVCILQATLSSLPALASDVQLQQLQPTIDTSTPAAATKPPAILLNGQVSKEDSSAAPASESNTSVRGTGTIFINGVRVENGAQLQETLRQLNATTPGLFIRMGGASGSFSELRPRQAKLSADDYRKMEYGVVGMVSRMTEGPPLVIKVFPTCPAAKAGIRPGDLVVKVDDRKLRSTEGLHIFWRTVAGKADTPVDITILRDGELLSFHMIRMNIEDIEDIKVRQNYERVLSLLGPPTGDGELKHRGEQSALTEMTGLEAP